VAFLLLLIPTTRKDPVTMNIGCILVFFGVFIEKGIGLVLPGFTPGTLGEVYEYTPSLAEVMICIGVAGVGMLVFTLLTKIAIPLSMFRELDDAAEAAARVGLPKLLTTGTALLVALLVPSGSARAAETGDSCVECHSDQNFFVTNKKLYDYFQRWSISIHGQEEVACFDCHGGNPGAAGKEAAHGSNLKASDRRSTVNFRNIPSTCGACHEEIYDGFRESEHFAHVEKKQRDDDQGPTCVTCHGSIDVAVLNVNTVEETCSRCHNEETENSPETPEKARALLNRFLSIHRYYRYITVRGDPAETREFFEEVDAGIRALSVSWHTFDLEGIEERTKAVLDSVRLKREEVAKAHKAKRASQPSP
jgi:nitrate/TMAO reductase-like tetraheme cytochrome c subunit